MQLVIISGLSGSGKSVAINTLEDDDFYCIDNMPISMLPTCIEHLTATSPSFYEKIAIGVDARNVSQDINLFSNTINQLKKQDIAIELIYLEADEETLIQRYSETRRKHPLTKNGLPLVEAIHMEKQILGEVTLLADLRIDTTSTNVRQLRSNTSGAPPRFNKCTLPIAMPLDTPMPDTISAIFITGSEITSLQPILLLQSNY